MIFGIGQDICEIKRIKKALKSERFLDKVFTEEEKEYILSKNAGLVQSAAGIFCAKEAVSKALGTGVRGFSLLDISVFHDSFGAPRVKLFGGAKKISDENEIKSIFVSITHSDDYAAATALLEK